MLRARDTYTLILTHSHLQDPPQLDTDTPHTHPLSSFGVQALALGCKHCLLRLSPTWLQPPICGASSLCPELESGPRLPQVCRSALTAGRVRTASPSMTRIRPSFWKIPQAGSLCPSPLCACSSCSLCLFPPPALHIPTQMPDLSTCSGGLPSASGNSTSLSMAQARAWHLPDTSLASFTPSPVPRPANSCPLFFPSHVQGQPPLYLRGDSPEPGCLDSPGTLVPLPCIHSCALQS